MHMECCLSEVVEQRGLTLKDVAAETGLEEERLKRIANNGFQALRKRTLVSICEVVQCQVGDFIKVVPD